MKKRAERIITYEDVQKYKNIAKPGYMGCKSKKLKYYNPYKKYWQ